MALGSYLPSFLYVKLDTDINLNPLNNPRLPDQVRATFAHEYVHFLQNISGGFGQLYTWNTYDRLRKYIVDINGDPSPELEIPLEGDVVHREKQIKAIRNNIQGGSVVPALMNDSKSQIIAYSLVKDEEYSILYPERPELSHVVLTLSDGLLTKPYFFGETAVSEMMAYLMEQKFSSKNPVPIPEYPYMVCRKLGEYIGTDLMENDSFAFALCDVSLLSLHPGYMFFKILKQMVDEKFKPVRAEDIFDFGINFLYGSGIKVYEDYHDQMKGAVYLIKQMLPDVSMVPTADWITYLYEKGYEIREKYPYFLIKLFNEPTLFEGYWTNIIHQFGYPVLVNKSNQRFFLAPTDLVIIEKDIRPVYLMALDAVRNTLVVSDTKCCKLLPYCDALGKESQIDKRCLKAPWQRAVDKPTCPYGMLWFHYGLHSKTVV